MKLYFDTNIYDFISDKQENQIVYDFLRDNQLELEASSTNLFETYAISDRDRCKQQLETLTTVATCYEKKPESWWQAKEVLSEIKRINPHWLRQPASAKLINRERSFLHNHSYNWEEACRLIIPHSPSTIRYRQDFEKGVSQTLSAQKLLKQRLLKNKLELTLYSTKKGKVIDLFDGKFLEPEMYWRVDCLLVWFEAISRRVPESRDYADWLLPYVRETAFNAPTYIEFWLNRVRGDKVSKNRISSLVSFYQMKQKVTHGNSNDQLHACHVFDADYFLTADKTFFKILEWVLPYFTDTAKIVFIDRRASSVFDQVTKAVLPI